MNYKMESIIIPVQDSEDSSSNDSDSDDATGEQPPEPAIPNIEGQQPKTVVSGDGSSSIKTENSKPESPTGKRRFTRRAYSAVASSKKRRKKRKKKFRVPGSTATSQSKDSPVREKPLANNNHVDNRKTDVIDQTPAPSQASLNAISARRIASAPANSANRKITRKEITPRAKLKLHDASRQDLKAEESTKSESTATTGSVQSQDTKITKLIYKPSSVRLLNGITTTPKATAITTAPLPSTKVNNEVSVINPSMALSNHHHVMTDKQRSMLLALSKESVQRTLPPVLNHNNSLNIYGNNDNSKDIKTAVSRYTSPVSSYSNKNVVLQRELGNPRCIPIIPDTDCTKLTRSQSAYNLGSSRNELNTSNSLMSSLGSGIDNPPKSILKEKINNRPYTARLDKKKSVRFIFADDEND